MLIPNIMKGIFLFTNNKIDRSRFYIRKIERYKTRNVLLRYIVYQILYEDLKKLHGKNMNRPSLLLLSSASSSVGS